MSLYRELAAAIPESHLPNVVMTLNNLGIMQQAQGRLENAAQVYEEALKICREGATRNPESYKPYVVMTLNNLGALHRDQNRLEEAGKAYEEALKICRDLASRIPPRICPMWPARSTTSASSIGIGTAGTMPGRPSRKPSASIETFRKQAPERFAADVERIHSLPHRHFSRPSMNRRSGYYSSGQREGEQSLSAKGTAPPLRDRRTKALR